MPNTSDNGMVPVLVRNIEEARDVSTNQQNVLF